MARIRKNGPGAAPGGYTWDSEDDIVEVPDDLATELLAIPDGGFTEVLPDTDEGGSPAVGLPRKKKDLQAMAAEMGLDTSGTAAEIAARIVAHQSDAAAQGDSADDDEDADEGDDGGEGTDAARTPVTEPDPDAS